MTKCEVASSSGVGEGLELKQAEVSVPMDVESALEWKVSQVESSNLGFPSVLS